MRQPTFTRSRRHTRRYRLARTGMAFAAGIVVIALIVNFCGGGEKELPIAQVAFRASTSAESNGARPKSAAVKDESTAILSTLNDWFQRAFVDPEQFEKGDFEEVAKHFGKDARADFTKQLTTLTIGDAREEVKRVTPQTATAKISQYWEKGKDPKYAYVKVLFIARSTLKDDDTSDLVITFSGDFTFEKARDWQVTYWRKVSQKQSSVPATPSGGN